MGARSRFAAARAGTPAARDPSPEEGGGMAVELGAAKEFTAWFEWLSTSDPPVAQELAAAVDEYAARVEAEQKVAFDVCVSPSGQLAFVAAHAGGEVFLAGGAEIEGSPRRAMIRVSR